MSLIGQVMAHGLMPKTDEMNAKSYSIYADGALRNAFSSALDHETLGGKMSSLFSVAALYGTLSEKLAGLPGGAAYLSSISHYLSKVENHMASAAYWAGMDVSKEDIQAAVTLAQNPNSSNQSTKLKASNFMGELDRVSSADLDLGDVPQVISRLFSMENFAFKSATIESVKAKLHSLLGNINSGAASITMDSASIGGFESQINGFLAVIQKAESGGAAPVVPLQTNIYQPSTSPGGRSIAMG